jgi:multidrug transporter EmrE-like cation transporter
MVLAGTLFAAAAQVLMKFGAMKQMPAVEPANAATWIPFLIAVLTNYPLVLGYIVQSGNALLLILALRDGELSLLYPIIGLTYVWVDVLALYFFHDQMNLFKSLGIVLVIGGVATLGRAGTRR